MGFRPYTHLMQTQMDPVAITQNLVRMDTVNPPGNEERAAEYLAGFLEAAGFKLQRVPFQPGRSGLVAVLRRGDGPYLCFSGHLDTVPVGDAEWTTDPFSGEIRGDRLYGRGASDMKSGVAAMTSAAISCAVDKDLRSNLLLAYSAAEETGCEGARSIAEHVPLLGEVGAIVVAEPTDNAVYVGHKGALWLELGFRGVTAHGAMPHLGKNAVCAAASVVNRLCEIGPEIGPRGPLGPPTLNVGTFRGGMNINSVPDAAEIQIDIRLVPGFSPEEALQRVRSICGPDTDIRTVLELPAVYTDPTVPWVQEVVSITRQAGIADTGNPGLSYFTDAGVLQPACVGAPTVFLGPGTPDLAHQTDEWCSVAQIRQAHDLFTAISRAYHY